MDPWLIFVLVEAVTLPLIVFVIYFTLKKRGSASKDSPVFRALSAVAEETGLQVVGGEPRYPDRKWLGWIRTPMKVKVEGALGSRKARVFHYTSGSGKNSTQYRCAAVSVRCEEKESFQITKEGAFSKIGKAIGMRDVQTGDPAFDGELYIRGNDPDFFRVALVDSIRDKIRALFGESRLSPRLFLDRGELKYAEVGSLDKEEHAGRFVRALGVLAEIADAYEVYHQRA